MAGKPQTQTSKNHLEDKRKERDPSRPESTSTGTTTGNAPTKEK